MQNIFFCPRCFKLRCPVHQLQYDLFLSSFFSTFRIWFSTLKEFGVSDLIGMMPFEVFCFESQSFHLVEMLHFFVVRQIRYLRKQLLLLTEMRHRICLTVIGRFWLIRKIKYRGSDKQGSSFMFPKASDIQTTVISWVKVLSALFAENMWRKLR